MLDYTRKHHCWTGSPLRGGNALCNAQKGDLTSLPVERITHMDAFALSRELRCPEPRDLILSHSKQALLLTRQSFNFSYSLTLS